MARRVGRRRRCLSQHEDERVKNGFYWFVIKSSKVLGKIFYHHQVFGEENLPEGRAIIAPNHASFFDPLLVGASSHEELHYLARRTLFEKRFLGLLLRNLNTHPVKLDQQDTSSLKMMISLLEEGKKIVIFPEGIRTHDGKLGTIKSGVSLLALKTNTPIVPVYLKGTFDAWPRQRKYPRLTARTSCTFGKPLWPDQFEGLSKKERQTALTEALKTSLKDLELSSHA